MRSLIILATTVITLAASLWAYASKSEPSLQCPKVKIENETSSWVEKDDWNFNTAKKTCLREYDACLSRFIKHDESIYSAMCKKPKKTS